MSLGKTTVPSSKRVPIAVVVGTRPEAIKLAPVIQALEASSLLEPITLSTSQHRDMVRQVFQRFDLEIDYDLKVMRPSQTLWNLSGRLAARLGQFFAEYPVKAVLVQGDTTTALFGGLSAFYHRIPVGHVEAGLRTGARYAPFPEEMNRKLLSALATWHFAPTREAARRLHGEGVPPQTIHYTGNTVVDALRWMAPRCSLQGPVEVKAALLSRRRVLLVTCHRRESLGAPMRQVAEGLARIARAHPDVVLVFPIHPNPFVRQAIVPRLKSIPNVILCPPMDYDQFLACLKRSHLVLTDSGGVQEEATALGIPVLVLRKETERGEGIKAGALKLVGTNANTMVRACRTLLQDPRAYARMCRASHVFGDGQAAPRIVRILERALQEMD